jgi:hypothetical protein
MRPAGIAIIGSISLVIVFVFVAYVQLILLCLALIVCLLIVMGFFRERHKPRTFWITTARKSDEAGQASPQDAVVKIEGRTFSIHDLPERLEFTIHWRNLHLLIAMAFIAIAALLACVVGTDLLTQQIDPATTRYFEFYFLCYFMVVLLFPALAWLSECTLMRAPGITLANIGTRGLWIAYQFTDPTGGYYGGSTFGFGGSKDDQLKIVFCNPKNPGFNKLSCSLLFHRIAWANESLADRGSRAIRSM